MSDEYSRQLLEEAERIREKDAQRKQARKNKRKPRPKRRPQTGRHERFRTWLRMAIVADLRIFIPLFSVGIVYMTLLIINSGTEFMGYGDLHAIFLALGGTMLIFLIGYYFVFRGWRNRLPFELHGWNELVDAENFSTAYWQQLEITIETAATDAQSRQLLEAALFIFRNNTKSAFYTTDFSDSRKRWVIEGLSANGSANPRVARYVYLLCTDTLTKLQKETRLITAVKLHTRGEQFYVSVPSAD